MYSEIAARVKAEFPRDRKMQNLFFDEVSTSAHDAPADEPSAEVTSTGSTVAEISG